MQPSSSAAKRGFTLKDKQKLLANLDIEVEHRTKQLEAWLSDAIKSFRSRNEGYLSRIPRIVLGVKMQDLEAKYNGNVLTCMKVLQMDKLAEGAAGVERSTKKRKWFAAQDPDPERGDESSRVVKNPRISTATPRGKTPVASRLLPTKPQFLRTPVIQRNMPSKPPLRRPSSNARSRSAANVQARPPSPSKISTAPQNSRRPPSSVTFNPEISDGFPSYPKHDVNTIKQVGKFVEQTRYFRNNGEMPGVREELGHKGNGGDGTGPTLRRANSITIRRQPSSVDFHSRLNSQASHPPQPQQHPMGDLNTVDSTATSLLPARHLPPVQVHVTVQTVDGFYLEFDPLAVSPGTLENLPGITEDAKKQAREDMVRLVKEAVSKWTD